MLVEPLIAASQTSDNSLANKLNSNVGTFRLDNETIFDGLSKLDRSPGLAFSIEYILKAKLKDETPSLPRFSSEINNATARQVLDWLCELDPRYMWEQHGNIVNVFPRAKKGDSRYLMNRIVPRLRLVDVKTSDGAVVQAVLQLDPPKEQIANLQAGGNWNFPEPWTEEFPNLSIREVANRAAQRLGPSYGWQLTGAEDFRIVVFHAHLVESAASR